MTVIIYSRKAPGWDLRCVTPKSMELYRLGLKNSRERRYGANLIGYEG